MRLYQLTLFASLAGASVLPSMASGQTVSFRDGLVSIQATNVPASRILAEWARIGGTEIVNGDKVTGPALTLALVDVPETKALEEILASAGGYVTVPLRLRSTPTQSAFEKILILATASAGGASRVTSTKPVILEGIDVLPPIIDEVASEGGVVVLQKHQAIQQGVDVLPPPVPEPPQEPAGSVKVIVGRDVLPDPMPEPPQLDPVGPVVEGTDVLPKLFPTPVEVDPALVPPPSDSTVPPFPMDGDGNILLSDPPLTIGIGSVPGQRLIAEAPTRIDTSALRPPR